jgi:hypothetical protein
MPQVGQPFPFVVQEHYEDAGTHWDLMLHRPVLSADDDKDVKVLATWKFSVPLLPENLQQPLSARALPDHRNAYLTYEGPITLNRGWCRIFDRGQYELIENTPDFWQVYFHGTHIQGRFVLKKMNPPDGWVLSKSPSNE